MAQTLENLHEPPVGLEQQMNWYDEQGREILKEPPEELKMIEENIKKHR